jgi:hypothetical protein
MWKKQIDIEILEGKEKGQIGVNFKYVNEDGQRTDEVLEKIVSNPDSLEQIAQDHINELDRLDKLQDLVDRKSFTIDLTPKEVKI